MAVDSLRAVGVDADRDDAGAVRAPVERVVGEEGVV